MSVSSETDILKTEDKQSLLLTDFMENTLFFSFRVSTELMPSFCVSPIVDKPSNISFCFNLTINSPGTKSDLPKDKLLREIEAAKRLIESGIEPLKVADEFIHDTFKLMEDGIIRRYPELNPKEVKIKVRENLVLIEKIKSLRKRRG